jgi:hypothetical protein
MPPNLPSGSVTMTETPICRGTLALLCTRTLAVGLRSDEEPHDKIFGAFEDCDLFDDPHPPTAMARKAKVNRQE